jgi:hypothetical protein
MVARELDANHELVWKRLMCCREKRTLNPFYAVKRSRRK